MNRDKLFDGLRKACFNNVPVSPRDIKQQLENVGFKVEYRIADYVELGDHDLEVGHFTQELRYNNRKYAEISYSAIKTDDGLDVYISQCFCRVCPRYAFKHEGGGVAPDRRLKVDMYYVMDVGLRAVLILDESSQSRFVSMYAFRHYKEAVERLLDGEDTIEYEYEHRHYGTRHREIYNKNDDGSYSAKLLNITHLECEEKLFYVVG